MRYYETFQKKLKESIKQLTVIYQTEVARKKSNSCETARQRLKSVIMQDRTSLSASLIEKMKTEIIDVIAKYLDIDAKSFNISLENQNHNNIALIANIPVARKG